MALLVIGLGTAGGMRRRPAVGTAVVTFAVLVALHVGVDTLRLT